MEITPVIPGGYQGLITQYTCRICKHLFALTASDAERYADVSYCHACSLILREELVKQQEIQGMLSSASTPAPRPLLPEPVVPLKPPCSVSRFVAQKPSLHIPQPRTIDREKMTVDQLLKEASMLTQTWRYREALTSYEQALMREPGCLAARAGKGVVLQKLRRFPEALAVYELMLEQDPTAIPTWVEKGWILIALRRYEEALATFEHALQLHPSASEPAEGKAFLLTEVFHAQNAEAFAQAPGDPAAPLEPLVAPALHSLGGEGRSDEVFQALSNRLQRDPLALNGYEYLAQWYLRKQPQQALATYEQALHLFPACATLHTKRAEVLRRLKRLPDALEACHQALFLDTTCIGVYAVQGHILAQHRQGQEALDAFDQAIALHPDEGAPFARKADLLIEMRREEEALESWSRNQAAP